MLHVITGGSGSGKSEYGENWLTKKTIGNEGFLYIATMMPFGEEAKERIKKHQKMREGKGFLTKEQYVDLAYVKGVEHKGVLLECMSNLVANEMYREDQRFQAEEVIKRILEGVHGLVTLAKNTVIITNEVSSDLMDYSEETREYIRVLGIINQEIARWADLVTEVVYGIPIGVKDERDEK